MRSECVQVRRLTEYSMQVLETCWDGWEGEARRQRHRREGENIKLR